MSEHIWLQISSGRGPVECQLAAAKLTDVLIKEARAAQLSCEVLEIVEGDGRGCALSALLSIGGAGALAFAGKSCGSVLWVCPSPVRPAHKRKNWFVGVEALTPADAETSVIRLQDVTFESMRASGPGGQHVNKTESAVRATHRPSGLVALAREERSQAMNKKLAVARLIAQVARSADKAQADADRDRWTRHDTLERGRPVRTFEGLKFSERL